MMKDIIENYEDAAESRFQEMTKDLPFGQYKCGCGRVVHYQGLKSELNFIGPNPWADPCCNQCLDDWQRLQEFK